MNIFTVIAILEAAKLAVDISVGLKNLFAGTDRKILDALTQINHKVDRLLLLQEEVLREVQAIPEMTKVIVDLREVRNLNARTQGFLDAVAELSSRRQKAVERQDKDELLNIRAELVNLLRPMQMLMSAYLSEGYPVYQSVVTLVGAIGSCHAEIWLQTEDHQEQERLKASVTSFWEVASASLMRWADSSNSASLPQAIEEVKQDQARKLEWLKAELQNKQRDLGNRRSGRDHWSTGSKNCKQDYVMGTFFIIESSLDEGLKGGFRGRTEDRVISKGKEICIREVHFPDRNLLSDDDKPEDHELPLYRNQLASLVASRLAKDINLPVLVEPRVFVGDSDHPIIRGLNDARERYLVLTATLAVLEKMLESLTGFISNLGVYSVAIADHSASDSIAANSAAT